MLVTGGGGNPHEKTAEIYNPAPGSGTFTLISALMAAGRAGHTATLLADGTILVVGGGPIPTYLDSADVYDPNAGTFTPTSSRLGCGAVQPQRHRLSDGRVLIAEGPGSSCGRDQRCRDLRPGDRHLQPARRRHDEAARRPTVPCSCRAGRCSSSAAGTNGSSIACCRSSSTTPTADTFTIRRKPRATGPFEHERDDCC